MNHKGTVESAVFSIVLIIAITSTVFLIIFENRDFLVNAASGGSGLLTPEGYGSESEECNCPEDYECQPDGSCKLISFDSCDQACKSRFDSTYSGECVDETAPDLIPADAELLFSDDFSNTQIVNNRELTGWPDDNGYVYRHVYRPETVSFVDLQGDRVVKVTAPGSLPSGRSTEIMQIRSEMEYWAETKIFFPNDFQLTSANEWFVFQGLMFEYIDDQNTLRVESVLWGNELRFILGREKVENGMIVDSEDAHTSPKATTTEFYFTRGVWHTMRYHIVRHQTNGVVEVWIDGTKVVDWRNIQTYFMQDQFNWIPIKHYTDAGETMKTVYFDDIVISTSPITTGIVPTQVETNLIKAGILQSYLKPNLYVNGKLYVTWMECPETTCYAKIKAYDYATETWGSEYTISSIVDDDDHRAPAIGYTPDKHLIVFYGTHVNGWFKYRVSTNVEDESSWSSEKTVTLPFGHTYPNPVSFDDRILQFFRSGHSDDPSYWTWAFVSTTKGTPEITDWSPPTAVFEEIEGDYSDLYGYAPYFAFQRIGNYIFGIGTIHHYSTAKCHNLYFVYSPDKGNTWKLADGTTRSLPIPLEDAKIVSDTTSNFPNIIYGYLDENNKPMFIARSQSSRQVQIFHYTRPIGEPGGSWVRENCVDEFGNVITDRRHFSDVMISPFYGRPAMWVVDANDYHMKFYVRDPGETAKWTLMFEEDSRSRADYGGPNFIKEPDRPASPWSLTQEENWAGRSDLWAYGLSSVGTSTGAQTTECDGTIIQDGCPSGEECCCSGTAPDLIPSDATLLWSKEWTDMTTNIPSWVILHDKTHLSIENNMLKMTADGGNSPPNPLGARPRVYLHHTNPLPDEYWMQAVFMIPTSFSAEAHLVFMEPLAEEGVPPYYTFQLVYSDSDGLVDAELKDVTNQIYYDREANVFSVTKGVPFEVTVHIKRDAVNGIIELWHGQNLVYSYYGKTFFEEDWNIPIVADHYKSTIEVTNSIYQRSIKVWVPPTDDWVPDDATLWISTDFENSYFINPDDIGNEGKLSDWPDVQQMVQRVHKMDIVADLENPDNKVLRVLYGEKTDYDKPNRPHIMVYHDFSEIYFSGWYYFPLDFEVVGWYILGGDWGQWSSYYASTYGNGIVIGGNGVIAPNLDFSVEIHDFPEHVPGSRRYLIPHTNVGKIPLGRWFNIRYHVKLHPTDGLYEYWFDKPDGNEPPDISYTGKTYEEIPDGPNTQISFADHYSDLGNPEKYQYSDNFEIWVR